MNLVLLQNLCQKITLGFLPFWPIRGLHSPSTLSILPSLLLLPNFAFEANFIIYSNWHTSFVENMIVIITPTYLPSFLLQRMNFFVYSLGLVSISSNGYQNSDICIFRTPTISKVLLNFHSHDILETFDGKRLKKNIRCKMYIFYGLI